MGRAGTAGTPPRPPSGGSTACSPAPISLHVVPITRTRRPNIGRGLVAAVVAGILSRRERPVEAAEADAPLPVPAPVEAPTRSARSARSARSTRSTRSEPVLVWADGRVAPKTGSFSPNAVANGALRPTAVPTETDGWDRLDEFALTYDGYAYWDNLPELAQRALSTWTRDGSLPPTLDERRACLFYEQRRWHHFGDVPAGRSLAYMWALAAAIRAELGAPAATPTGTTESGPALGTDAAASFVDDDAGFLAWLKAHPEGLVLNTGRTPSARYLKLHRARCSTLAEAEGRAWTVSHRRVCAGDRAALEAWAAAAVGAAPDPCKRCKP